MKKLLSLLIISVALLTACKGTGPETALPTVASIVTFEGAKDGVAEFSYVETDGHTVRLYAAWNAPAEFTAGRRALIHYQAAEYGVDGEIVLSAVVPIPMGKAEVAAEIPRGVDLIEPRAWRSGEWLNLGAKVTFAGDAESIDLLVKEETLFQAVPEAYVVVTAGDDGRAAERQLYATWRIDSILNLPGVEGLKVILNPTTEVEIK